MAPNTTLVMQTTNHHGITKNDRRASKPLMEKRRRERINKSLNELKSILLEALRKDVSYSSVYYQLNLEIKFKVSSHTCPSLLVYLRCLSFRAPVIQNLRKLTFSKWPFDTYEESNDKDWPLQWPSTQASQINTEQDTSSAKLKLQNTWNIPEKVFTQM